MMGKVSVQFSKNIYSPQNYTQFNDSQLALVILDPKGNWRTDVAFTWSVISMQGKEMYIQLSFEDKTIISI